METLWLSAVFLKSALFSFKGVNLAVTSDHSDPPTPPEPLWEDQLDSRILSVRPRSLSGSRMDGLRDERGRENNSEATWKNFLWSWFTFYGTRGTSLNLIWSQEEPSSPRCQRVSWRRCRRSRSCQSWRQSDSWNGFKRHLLALTLLTLPSSTIGRTNAQRTQMKVIMVLSKKFHLCTISFP